MAAPFAIPLDLQSWMQQEVPYPTAAQALATASGAIRAHCGWSVSAETVTGLRLRPTYRGSMWLPTLYLTGVTSLAFGPVVYAAGVDFDWWSDGRVELLTYRAGLYPTAATVSFTHGYPEGHTLLDLVKGVCLSAAARCVDNPLSYRSEQIGGESWTTGGQDPAAILSQAEQTQLGPLMLPMLA